MTAKLQKGKLSFHPRNKHQGHYDFDKLTELLPELKTKLFVNKYGNITLDFSDSEAVKLLNKALLRLYYGVIHWDIPPGYLCPPIPGRADYVHFVADILAEDNGGLVPKGKQIKCLDIGTGANCIYPIIGSQEYGWSFVGTDIDLVSVKSAKAIVAFNDALKNQIELRLQSRKDRFFEGVIKKDERFDITLCNPPFYSSAEEALESNSKKTKNLSGKKTVEVLHNFGGSSNELWCDGGELKFILAMIRESVSFSDNCSWFTSLVSKKEHLERIYKEFDKLKIKHTKTIEMAQGQKVSRFVAWRF